MNFFKFFIITAAVFVSSCSNDDNLPNGTVSRPQSYHFRNMHYPIDMLMSPTLDNLVKISYGLNNKITKRVGGFVYYSPGSGAGTGFTDLIYDDVEYVNNEIHIIRKLSLIGYGVSPFERKLILDNNNRIVKKIIYQENAVYPNLINDTIRFSYNNLNQISEAFSGSLNSYNTKSKYYYNSDGNLDSIVSKRQYQEESYLTKTKEIFSNYDNSINPMKKLILFEETFYKAISKNNYSKYDMFTYTSNNVLIGYEHRNWNMFYDDFGNINYNLF